MNRKEEFEAMIEELNQPAPGLEATLDRAYKKKRKRTAKMIVRPVAGLAACFAVFVLLVNFCAPVAYACSLVPGLRELAAAVTFSRSLTDAVENEYVQPMKYISIGAVTKPSTEHIVYVSHCGYDYTLTGEQAALWLDGRYGFDAARNQLQLQALHQLERMGLVVATEDVLEGEYRALTRVRLVPAKAKNAYSGLSRDEKTALKWIRETGLVLSMAELVFLMERDIQPEEKYLGQEHVQALVQRIYTRDTIADNILENQMERAEKRDYVVKLVLRLLKKKHIVLL